MTINPTEVIRYQYSNHVGSASLELDDLAEIISYEEYHPFGTTSYRSGRTETETSQKRYKYVGKERDEETGLYYYGARYYAAWICRFVSVDPLQFDYPYYTPFQYAGNKPVSYIDLDGLEEAKPDEIKEPPKEDNENSGWYCPKINKFDYNGTGIDYVSAIDNGVINLLNIIPELWNSGVANVEGLKEGTWTETKSDELNAMGTAIKDWAVGSWEYTFSTPISEQFIDTGKALIQPETIETLSTLFFGSKIPKLKNPLNKSLKVKPKTAKSGGGLKQSTELVDDAVKTSTGVEKYSVGAYNEMQGVIPGLDAHHVGQKALMSELIPGYSANTAPSILVPKVGHTIRGPFGIVSRKTSGLTNARQVIARDVFKLRRVYPDIPNNSLQNLIQMNKTMYPSLIK